jgi:2-polyprenyl-3-methyl-5-hydroxy-6-metoxy-1,4-benzoquinol methylase
LPATHFNGKDFSYYRCADCAVHYLSPLPTADDYLKMYPPEYQSGVSKTILPDLYKKLIGLRFSYGYQFDLLRKHAVHNPVIMDYGCGSANFLVNAVHEGFRCDGAEFNPAHVEILKKEITDSNFFTIGDFLNSPPGAYSVIRLSNVLEHMDNPNEVIAALVEKLPSGGLLLVEGPIETNFNLAFLSRKMYFKLQHLLKHGYRANHTPTHITFTNYKNQKQFFEKFGLTTRVYTVSEAAWPYPPSRELAQGIGGKVKFCIAIFSIFISRLFPRWGNTFIYAGRKE